MAFQEAVKALGRRVRQEEMASVIGVSLSSIRQAQLDPNTPSYRSPPKEWRSGLASLARTRAEELLALADALECLEE